MRRMNATSKRGALLAAFAAVVIHLGGPWGHALAATDAPPGMTAVTLDDVARIWPKLSPMQRLAALDQMIALGAFERAEQLLTTTSFPPLYAVDALALLAALRNKQGRAHEAASIAANVIKTFPAHRRARFELAQAKFLIEDDIAARQNFEFALDGADPQMDRAIRLFIDRMDNRKRWTASAYVSAAGSTNISQGSDTRVIYFNGLPFQLDESAASRPGAGIWTGVAAGYTHPLASGVDLLGAVSANVKRFTEETFNDSIVAASIGPRWSFLLGGMPTQVGVYLTAGYRWVTDEPYSGAWGGRIGVVTKPDAWHLINLSLACDNKLFSADWKSNDLSYQDGLDCALAGALDRQFTPATFVRLLGAVERDAPGLDHLQHDMWQIGAGIGTQLPWGFAAYAQTTYSQLGFDGVFPGTTSARDDTRCDASLLITNKQWSVADFLPGVQYSYTVNSSNVSFYDFEAHGLTFTLARDF